MSSERSGANVIFSCDICGEEYEVYDRDFRAAWEDAKDDGWRCFKNDDDEWEHRCPECVGE